MPEFIIGVDEVGWGCVAGPIVVCACVVPFGHWETLREWGFRDSKAVGNRTKVSDDKRTRISDGKCDRLSQRLQNEGEGMATWVITQAEPITIDLKTPADAKEAAFRRAIIMLMHQNNWAPEQVQVIVDGKDPIRSLPSNIAQHAEPKADDTILPVSVASVLAKSYRDRQMTAMHELYPTFNFASNKGYPTPEHVATVFDNGPIRGVHRMCYLKTTMINYYQTFTDRDKRRKQLPQWIVDQGWITRTG